MIIGGIQKTSFIDYPGCVSCVIFLSGCNCHCPYCHNPDLISGKPEITITPKTIFTYLEKRRHLLDGIVITGGEPTLSSTLINFCRCIKEMGYPIKIDTNGSQPEILQTLIDKSLVDYIAMDIKTDINRYQPLITKHNFSENIMLSIEKILLSDIQHEFRTTCAPKLVKKSTIIKIGSKIKNAQRWYLQQVKEQKMLNPSFFAETSWPSEEDMHNFQSIGSDYVECCMVR